jgi:hypothetical protein
VNATKFRDTSILELMKFFSSSPMIKLLDIAQKRDSKFFHWVNNILAYIIAANFWLRSYFVSNTEPNKKILFGILVFYLYSLYSQTATEEQLSFIILFFGMEMIILDFWGSFFANYLQTNPTFRLSVSFSNLCSRLRTSSNMIKRYVGSQVSFGFVHGRTGMFFTGKAALLIAGATVGGNLVNGYLNRRHAAAEAEKGRQYTASEADKNRHHAASEADKDRQSAAAEADKNRQSAAFEADKARAHEKAKWEHESSQSSIWRYFR